MKPNLTQIGMGKEISVSISIYLTGSGVQTIAEKQNIWESLNISNFPQTKLSEYSHINHFYCAFMEHESPKRGYSIYFYWKRWTRTCLTGFYIVSKYMNRFFFPVQDILLFCWAYEQEERPSFSKLVELLEKLPKRNRRLSHPVHFWKSAEYVKWAKLKNACF